MPFTTACPNCSARLQVPDTLAGKRVRCKKCSEPFLVEGPAEDDEAETPAPAKARSRPREDDERPSKKSRPAADEDEADEDEEDRPAPRKKKNKKKPQGVPPLVIGLVLGGVILVGGGIAAFFLLKDDKKDDTELAAAKGKGGEGESGPPWVDYVDAEAKYRIRYPAQPSIQTQAVMGVTLKAAVLNRGPTNFVSYSVVVPPAERGDPEQVLDRAVQQAAGMMGGGSITDKKPITHQGKPGRELKMTIQGMTGVVRIFYVNDRMYNLTVIGQNVTPETPIVKPFFDSLQFD